MIATEQAAKERDRVMKEIYTNKQNKEETTNLLIRKMFEKQDELNVHTNGSDWKQNKNLKWYRAIWTEAAELIDYTNWKWWRKQDVSIKDIEMELIDIWHFAMSDLLVRYTPTQYVTGTFLAFKSHFREPIKTDMNIIQEATEKLAYMTLRDEKFHLESFIDLCSSLNMDIEKIYKLYMGKNILNKFRQDHGYKTKTYIKDWNGQEDNIYLMKTLDNIKEIDDNFEKIVYDKLTQKYKTISKGVIIL
jgi:dimeric dUTPase (all-alpha-NTP-PPase superfamily)